MSTLDLPDVSFYDWQLLTQKLNYRFSTTELAREISVSRSTVNSWRKGVSTPLEYTSVRLLLGLSAKHLTPEARQACGLPE